MSLEAGRDLLHYGGTDIHNHLMAGVDDGAADEAQAREALAALHAAGVRRIATTPHVDASVLARKNTWERRAAALDAAWERLCEIARDTVPDVQLHRAAEVRLDVPAPDLSDPRVRMGGGTAVLIEFAYFAIPPFSERVLGQLLDAGWTPIIAHPERYRGLAANPGMVATWRAAGAVIQVNAGSLTGRYGPEPRAAATRLLEQGWIDCLASDYHARGVPHLQAAREWLEANGGAPQAVLLLEVNPNRILDGEVPQPVPPLERPDGWMSRVLRAVRGR